MKRSQVGLSCQAGAGEEPPIAVSGFRALQERQQTLVKRQEFRVNRVVGPTGEMHRGTHAAAFELPVVKERRPGARYVKTAAARWTSFGKAVAARSSS